jgi:hypothetical protein
VRNPSVAHVYGTLLRSQRQLIQSRIVGAPEIVEGQWPAIRAHKSHFAPRD